MLPPEKLRNELRPLADQQQQPPPPQQQQQQDEQERALATEAIESAAEVYDDEDEEAEAREADELLVIPGLDGSLFVIGEEGEAHPLTDHTVQVCVWSESAIT